jgi:ubiquinone/menaquinone biosynthesis C-methylase UbiE
MADPVMEMFDCFSEGYSDHFSTNPSARTFSFRKRLALACELADGYSGRLLDCAAGTGEITHALLKSGQFREATIVDISPQMLATTGQALSQLDQSIHCDFENKSIFDFQTHADKKFDLIVCLGLVAHTGRLTELLTHLKSMLTDKGAILLQTSLGEHFGNRIVRAVSSRRYTARFGYSISYFRHNDIVCACSESQLNIIRSRRHTIGVPFGDRLWPRGNYNIERRLESWAERHGADALYLLEQE